ncbi:MAG TPA: hypothetical protein VNF07_13255 [Acidimicrobiales bacterium]|nr:hypothetical protein [Acidimicrobiales bacterium]
MGTIEEEQLTTALDDLTKKFAGNVTSVSRIINPLLNVWSEAHAIDPEIAEPLEGLLTALAHRVLTTDSELATAVDEVRLRLARHQSLAADISAV